MPSTAEYPRYPELRGKRLAARRSAAAAALRRAGRLAQAAGARILVFGSLVEGGFHEGSDLDVGLLGCASDKDSALAAEIDTLLSLSGFSADVIPERFMSASLLERVLSHGRGPGALG